MGIRTIMITGDNPLTAASIAALVDRVKADVEKRRGEGVAGGIPADLATASGSGLDPDLSPEAALAQVPRIARVRGIADAELRALVERSVDQPLAGVLGEPRVNVLALNRQLDGMRAKSAP
jgi:K+-transporting ATPase ATPase C chain